MVPVFKTHMKKDNVNIVSTHVRLESESTHQLDINETLDIGKAFAIPIFSCVLSVYWGGVVENKVRSRI